MNPIRVAIVGCGRISDLHQLGYHGRQDAKIVAVCDSQPGRPRKRRPKNGAWIRSIPTSARCWKIKRSTRSSCSPRITCTAR